MAWRKITCVERDVLLCRAGVDGWRVSASLTDLDGRFGVPEIFTEWSDRATGVPTLRDYRYPQRNGERPDVRPCEHLEWVP